MPLLAEQRLQLPDKFIGMSDVFNNFGGEYDVKSSYILGGELKYIAWKILERAELIFLANIVG